MIIFVLLLVLVEIALLHAEVLQVPHVQVRVREVHEAVGADVERVVLVEHAEASAALAGEALNKQGLEKYEDNNSGSLFLPFFLFLSLFFIVSLSSVTFDGTNVRASSWYNSFSL